MLTWNQAEPCTQIPGFGETAGITHRGDKGCCVQHANAGDGGEAPCSSIIARQFDELPVQTLDPGIEFSPFCTQFAYQLDTRKNLVVRGGLVRGRVVLVCFGFSAPPFVCFRL